jgi:hypothetical protein
LNLSLESVVSPKKEEKGIKYDDLESRLEAIDFGDGEVPEMRGFE